MTTTDVIGLLIILVIFAVDWYILAKLTYVKWANAVVIPTCGAFVVLWAWMVFG